MRKWKVMACVGLLLAVMCVSPSYGGMAYGETAGAGQWVEKTLCQADFVCGDNIGQDTAWYYLTTDDTVATGWVFTDGYWYFLNTTEGVEKGRTLTGWQWVDGRCYYLAEVSSLAYPLGAMYAGEKTPDGCCVGNNGAWLDEGGVEQYIPGKGFITAKTENRAIKAGAAGGTKKSGKSGFGGGGGSGSGGSSSENREDGRGEKEWDEGEEWTESTDQTVNQERDEERESATPSDARKVMWEVSFVDEEDKNRRIFREQRGEAAEGTELLVDFPEVLEGNDGWRYLALEKSPKRITVAGTGLQKYVVLFRKEEQKKEEPEPEDGKEQLDAWIQTAKLADTEITGEMTKDWQVITDNQEESRERLLNLVSMVTDGDRHEIYLIARNHSPSAVVLGQKFPDVTGVSELVMDEFLYSGDRYCILRVGFQRTWEEESCIHDMETEESVAAGCTSEGHDKYRCRRCSYEETVYFPAAGHRDENGDGICEVCYVNTDGGGSLGEVRYREGDIQVRTIGGRQYRFRCIDEDYSDDKDNSGYAALFLCDTVIRSDAESKGQTGKKINFGSDNNYKTSNIRKWLRDKTEEPLGDISRTYIGVNTAYQGATGRGEYEQFAFDDLKGYEKTFQMLEDQMFILSIEEAVKYRDFLWKFNGSDGNNPESQYSPYSRGYYLRTPQYEGGESFQYGNSIYAVDLFDGSIHPVDVSDTSMGIRPVYIVSQNREESGKMFF